MKRERSSSIPLACLGMAVAHFPATALGLGIRVPDLDAHAVARGNAFVATADNPSAIYYNPAGICQIEGFEARFDTFNVSLSSTYTAPNGRQSETFSEIYTLPQFYSVLSPTNSHWSFGMGMYTPYGLGLDWGSNTRFSPVTTRSRMMYLTANPVVGYEISPHLSFAAGPTLSYAKTDLERSVGITRFLGDGLGASFNVGGLWKITEQHSFGVTYRGPASIDFEGYTTLSAPPYSQTASAQFDFPQQLVAGYSFRPTPDWNFEFDVDWTDWNSLDTVWLKQPIQNIPMFFDWNSSFMFEWGVTRNLPRHFSASAGYIYSQNSVPASRFNPSIPDSDRHVFSVGVGQKYTRWEWDVAYQAAYGPTREISGSVYTPLVDGKYEFMSHAISVAFNFTF